jgi:carboxyl-terminal processing protease
MIANQKLPLYIHPQRTMNHKHFQYLKLNFIPALFLALSIFISSCDQDDDPSPVVVDETNTHVNDWILETMDFWYLWSNELPAAPNKNQQPDEFFQSLLSDDDRFSWIQEDYQELLNSLQGISKEAGFEFVLYKEDGNNNIIAQILYVKPSSPAQNAGLKRGDVITHVNGQQLNTTNYQTVLEKITDNSFTLSYKELLIDQEEFSAAKTVSLSSVVYAEDPNYLSNVVELNDRKIGYYVYNFFSPGTDGEEQKYDLKMDNVFAGFKAKGVTDLVLDLRFNSGGSEVSANNLASLIVPDPDGKIFFRREYNTKVEEEILSDPNAGASFLQSKLKSKAENIGNQLPGKIYILTSARTASASELIINGLRPYMDVFLIGDVTYGKNVGSVSLYDEEDPKNTWGMQPIIVKVYNSLNQSDYSQGFSPDIKDEDNKLFIYPLGDTREELLSKAIEQITGIPAPGRKAQLEEEHEVIGHSLDNKRRSFTLTVELLKK